MEHMMDVYELLNPSIPSWATRWGAIADVSLRGWCIRGSSGVLKLTRAGPFIPPISLPESDMSRMIWEVLVTDAFKKSLEVSGLSGFTFRPVIKHHIIWMEWEKWALTHMEPPEPLETDGFVDYFTKQPHNPETADQLGDLWEVCLEHHAKLDPTLGVIEWDGTDWFRAKDPTQNTDYIYVSARARTWLRQTVPEWVTFGDTSTVLKLAGIRERLQKGDTKGWLGLDKGYQMPPIEDEENE